MKTYKNIQNYFNLLEVFTIREIKSRYKASLLGPLWIVVYPLISAVTLSFVFDNFININSETSSYFIFVLSGLIIWNFFQQGISLAKDSLIWNRDLITKTAFSKDTLPISYVLSKTPDFFIYISIFIFFYLINGYRLDVSALLMFAAIIPLLLFSAALALVSSLANAIFRDFGKIIEFVLMILFYATPIIYPISSIPPKYGWISKINPLSLLIVFIRDLMFKEKINYEAIILSTIISFVSFLISYRIFKIYEKKLADLI